MRYIVSSGPGSSASLEDRHSTYRLLIRTVLCGALFAVPLCVIIPNSPLLRLWQTQDYKKALIPRMMSDFLYVNFIARTASDGQLVEPYVKNPAAKEGFLPYLRPLTAQVPGLSCLVVSHLFHPGMWALPNKVTWQSQRREFVRLNTECVFAFAPLRVPAAIGLGTAVGLVLYPFK